MRLKLIKAALKYLCVYFTSKTNAYDRMTSDEIDEMRGTNVDRVIEALKLRKVSNNE